MPIFLRSLIFYPMMWLRGISGFLLTLLSGLLLVGGILFWVIGE